jgi:F-type H+-transporting ATPase subunit b
MSINATFIGQIIVFLILLWVFARFVVPPLAAANEARQRKIADGLAAAEKGQKDLSQARQAADEVLREARMKATQIVDNAQHRANELIEQAKNAAIAEGERLIAAAQQQTELAATRARESLRKEVAALAVAGASQLIEREVDAKTHAALLDRLVTQI